MQLYNTLELKLIVHIKYFVYVLDLDDVGGKQSLHVYLKCFTIFFKICKKEIETIKQLKRLVLFKISPSTLW